MDNTIESFEFREQERTALNNNVIVPEYRKFCKDNNLLLHFWDELPLEEFNPELALDEIKLHQEAMNCFNNLKPRFVLFNNMIYSYHFRDWGGGFDYSCWEVEDFLNQSFECNNRVSGLEKQLRSSVGPFLLIIGAIIIFVVNYFSYSFLKIFSFPLGVVIAGFTVYFIQNKFFSDPLMRHAKEIKAWEFRLENLKTKFS